MSGLTLVTAQAGINTINISSIRTPERWGPDVFEVL
jgi:hypothetical protein